MYSQCPACLARFRVTADRLRAAHGRARCGRCGEAFDLLERLSDELPAPSGVEPTPPAASEAANPPLLAVLAKDEWQLADGAGAGLTATAEDYHFSAEDVEKVFIDARDWQRQYGTHATAGAADLAAADPSQLVVDEPQGVEDITLEGLKVEIESDTGESTHLEAEFDYVEEDEQPSNDRVAETEEDEAGRFYQPLIEDRELPVTPPLTAVPAAAVGPEPTPVAMRADPRASLTERLGEPHRRPPSADDDLPDFDLAAGPAIRRPAHPWLTLGSVLLALALALQLTHHFRRDIARHPQAGPALRRLYELIGQPLSPNWDLDAFEVNQWGPTADVAPGSALVVRAELTNRADHPQPYPLLRLEFEDRFGAAVAQRDFTPVEYLKSPSQAQRQLASGEATEAELSVIAPGADAVGYRLDICLREGAGRVRCAHGE